MAFEPDIIVTGADSPEIALVAQVQLRIRDFVAAERQLKAYIAGMGCPIGLLITPERLWLYRDRYLAPSEDSIDRVGEFDVSGLFGLHGSETTPNAAVEFESKVQSWLEGLGTEAGLRELPAEFRRAAEAYIAPAVSQGAVRAGHPRSLLNA